MVRLRDDYEDPRNPDELSDGEEPVQWEHTDAWKGASDVEICREADLGNPVADEIFHSWPAERQRAAARKVDAENRA